MRKNGKVMLGIIAGMLGGDAKEGDARKSSKEIG